MAGGISEKKRKRLSEKHDRPSKKPALEEVRPPVKVQFVQNEDGAAPIIASTPGVNIPNSIPLSAYAKPRAQKRTSNENNTIVNSELLLQSSAHPKIDFLGKEGENELDTLWNHYAAVYDREAGTLQVVEVRKMTVRGSVRQPAPVVEEDESEEEVAPQTMRSQRAALTETFGTKQSIKQVQSIAENELLSNALAGAGPTAAESALLSSMPKESLTSSSSQQKSTQAEIQAAKPLPQPNLSATQPAGVYTLESLVPNGMATLRSMPVKDWQDAINGDGEVVTTSRFVSRRVDAVVRSGDKTALQLLRFILILIEFARSLKPSKGGPAGTMSRKLRPREDLRKALSTAAGSSSSGASTGGPSIITDSFVDSLRRKFVPAGSFLSKNELTFLHATLCALTLHIPPSSAGLSANELATDPADLRDDLRLENQTILQLFRELGCRVDKPRETEFVKWGVKSKAEAAARRIARLKLPVEFPKVSRGGKK